MANVKELEQYEKKMKVAADAKTFVGSTFYIYKREGNKVSVVMELETDRSGISELVRHLKKVGLDYGSKEWHIKKKGGNLK